MVAEVLVNTRRGLWKILVFGLSSLRVLLRFFYNNCFKTGILPIVLDEKIVADLVEKSKTYENYELTVDLENRTVFDDERFRTKFEIEAFRQECLLHGLDDIGLTLQKESQITVFEQTRPSWLSIM